MNNSLTYFLEASDQAWNWFQIPLPKPKVDIGSTESVDKLFTHYYKVINEESIRQRRFSFRFEKKANLVFLPWKKLSYRVNSSNLEE